MYVLLHAEKGTPFETADQGKFRYATLWEQLDYAVQYSASRKFLTVVPIVLWVTMRCCFYWERNKRITGEVEA